MEDVVRLGILLITWHALCNRWTAHPAPQETHATHGNLHYTVPLARHVAEKERQLVIDILDKLNGWTAEV